MKRVNHSRFRIVLEPAPFEGILIYSSVTDATNSLGQGAGEAWILVYGYTDFFPPHARSISLAPGTGRQNTYCIGDTFTVEEAGKEKSRQVRLQGKLRIEAFYDQRVPRRKINKQKQEKTTRTYLAKDNSTDSSTFGKVMLEIPIPCPNGVGETDCLSPPPIFQGEHDFWTIVPEPPPTIEVEPASPPTFATNPPPPPKP